jgi:predicted ABC-type ATPase
VPKKAQTPHIYVIAGTNGAGKSSIAGAMLIEEGVDYFNPMRQRR